MTATFRGGVKLLPHQARFVRWAPPPDVVADGFSEEAILGGWGSAKTIALMAKTLAVAVANRRHPGYPPEIYPRVVVTGPVERTVLKVLIPKFRQVCPRELIRKVHGRPHPAIRLVNDCVVEFMSYDAVIEGDDLAAVVVDEVHKLTDATQLQNLRNRVRDPWALRRAFLAAGLPESGWVREQFDVARMDQKEQRRRQTMLVGTELNTHLPKSHLESILSSCPDGYQASLVGGGWMPPENALYPMFSADRHVVPAARYRANQPIAAVGIDIGRSAAAVICQEEKIPGVGPGVLVVDEVLLQHSSVEDMAAAVKAAHGPRLRPGVTVVAVDPTIRDDELNAIYRTLPGLYVKKRPRTDPFYHVNAGIRLVQAALLNAKGESRLHFVAGLNQHTRGVLDSLLNTKFHPRSGERVKDNTRDHAEDALRYACNAILADKGFAPSLH